MSNSPQNNRQRGGGPGMAMMVPGEKAKNFKRSVKLLANRLRPFAWIFITVTIFAIGSTTFNIFGPKLLGNATTKLFEGLMAKMAQVPGAAIDFNYIGNIALTMLGLYGLSAIFAYIQGYLISKVSSSIGYEFRKDLLDKLSRLPLSYFDKTPNGEILSRITNDVDTLTSSLNQIFTQLITSVTFLIGITIMMLSISWEMSLIAFAVLPVSFSLISIIVKFSQKYFKQQQVSLGQVNGHIEETYGGHLVVKTFNGEPQALQQFENYNNELYRSAWKSQFFSSVMQPLMGFIGHLGYISACILGGIFTIQGRISVGDIQAFIQYLQNFNQPIVQTAQISNLLQSTAAAAERIFEFLAETEEAPETDKSSVPSTIEGSVEFKDVCFGYNADQPVIQHFSASVKPGQTVAIVGPTGAGKTTLVKLLMRFYDLQQGTITVDGVDTTNYPRQQLRKVFGMVLQDTWLFNGSIRENIRYGALDADNATIEQAADTAYADHFTRALPKGYEFVLNEEASNVSAGQKQLLTIARAFIANPKILILDEATSSVDTRTEGLIQKAMVKLMKNRTCFVIAHRLSTIRNADLILVMRDGNIVEQGTHDELIAMNQFYAQLYNAQFERS